MASTKEIKNRIKSVGDTQKITNAMYLISSTKMREGLYHKTAEVGLLFVGIMIDGALLGGFDFGYSAPVFTAICVYICIMEVGSLLEIFASMNPELQNSPIFAMLDSVNDTDGRHTKDE